MLGAELYGKISIVSDKWSGITLNDVFQKHMCHFFLGIGKIFFFLMKHCECGLAFDVCNASTKTTVMDLQNSVFNFIAFYLALSLNQEHFYIKSWIAVSGVLAMIKEITEWVMEEVVINASYNQVDHLQKQGLY